MAENKELETDKFLVSMLDKKIPESSEIQLILFQHCNLSCNFCGQDHKSRTGIDTITQKADEIIKFIKNNIRKSHIVNIMGGEVFNDDLPDHVFNDYKRLIFEVNQYAISTDQIVRFNWATNLIFKNYEKVQKLFADLDKAEITTYISTSYDFFGRKTALWKDELFKANVEYFSDRIKTINFVLTRPAIQYMINEKDEYFDYLYSKFHIFFEYFQPEKNSDLLMPTDDELLEMFLFLAKKYPNVSPINDWLKNDQNRMTCYGLNSMTLLPDGKKARCRYLSYKEGDFKHKVNYQNNGEIVQAFMAENECLSCEWYNRCSMRCFVQADWSKRQKSQRCIFKTFFEKTVK